MRELKNAMESIVVFHRGTAVDAPDLSPEIRAAAGVEGRASPPPFGEGERREMEPAGGGEEERTMADIEREAILAALDRTGGRRAEAAKLLDIGLRTLQRKLKEYKLQGHFGG